MCVCVCVCLGLPRGGYHPACAESNGAQLLPLSQALLAALVLGVEVVALVRQLVGCLGQGVLVLVH